MKTKSRIGTGKPGNVASKPITPGNVTCGDKNEALDESWSDDDFFQDNSFILKATQCPSVVMSPLATGCKRRTSFEISSQPDPKTSKYSPRSKSNTSSSEKEIRQTCSRLEPVTISTASVVSTSINMSSATRSVFTKPSSSTVLCTDKMSNSNKTPESSSHRESSGFKNRASKAMSSCPLLISSKMEYGSTTKTTCSSTSVIKSSTHLLDTSSHRTCVSSSMLNTQANKFSGTLTSSCVQTSSVTFGSQKLGKPPLGRQTVSIKPPLANQKNSCVTTNHNPSRSTEANQYSASSFRMTNVNSCRSGTVPTNKSLSPMNASVSVLPSSQSPNNGQFRFKKYNSFDSSNNRSNPNIRKGSSANYANNNVISKTGMRRTNSFDGSSYVAKSQTVAVTSIHKDRLVTGGLSTVKKPEPTKPLLEKSTGRCSTEFSNPGVSDVKSNVFDTSLPDELLINLSEPDELLDSQEILDIGMAVTSDFSEKFKSSSSKKNLNATSPRTLETVVNGRVLTENSTTVLRDSFNQNKKNSSCDQSKSMLTSNSFCSEHMKDNYDNRNGSASQNSSGNGIGTKHVVSGQTPSQSRYSFKKPGGYSSVSQTIPSVPGVQNGIAPKTNSRQDKLVVSPLEQLQLQGESLFVLIIYTLSLNHYCGPRNASNIIF